MSNCNNHNQLQFLKHQTRYKLAYFLFFHLPVFNTEEIKSIYMFIQYRIRVVLIYMRVALLKTRYQIFAAPVAPAPTRLHMCFRDDDFIVNNLPRTDRPSRTAEISPLFDRKLKVRFTFCLWSTFEIQVLN